MWLINKVLQNSWGRSFYGTESSFVTKYLFTLNSIEILQWNIFLRCIFPIVAEDTVDTGAILHPSVVSELHTKLISPYLDKNVHYSSHKYSNTLQNCCQNSGSNLLKTLIFNWNEGLLKDQKEVNTCFQEKWPQLLQIPWPCRSMKAHVLWISQHF